MKKLYSFTLAALGFSFMCSGQFTDDIESYELGPVFNDQWTTWDATDDGSQNATVSSYRASSETKSIHIAEGVGTGGPQDAVLSFGEGVSSGVWSVSWMMYIPADSSAYFNLQGNILPSADDNLEFLSGNITFNGEDDSPGMGSDDNEDGLSSFSFPHDEWFEVKATVNFDFGIYSLTIDGEETAAAPIGADVIQWGGIDFFAAQTTNGFYVDDVSFYSDPLSIEDVKENAFAIYPNPTSGNVQIYSSDILEKMTVFNILGEEVYSCSTCGSQQLDFSDLDPGHYFIQTSLGAEHRTYKLIKQ